MNNRLQVISDIFNSAENIKVIVPFQISQMDKTTIFGKIRLTIKKEQLTFKVNIPIEYPLVNGSFSTIFSCCDKIKGFLHQVQGDKICIVSPKTAILSEKLTLEINALKEWMLKYYINEEEDEQYEYLAHVCSDKEIKTKLLFTSIEHTFKKHDSGVFKYASFIKRNGFPFSQIYEIQFIQSIDNKKCHWANRFHALLKYENGLWFYIEDEPIITPGVIIENSQQLIEYFNQKQIDFLDEKLRNFDFKSTEFLNVIIGYDISRTDEQEVHWQLIKISIKNKPIRQQIQNGKPKGRKIMKHPIHWSITKNNSYNRFFGRGKLSDFITERNVLIIGVGAIGSSLAVSLARSGLKNICLSDFDLIETGNICRSEYLLVQENISKVLALSDILHNISPFLNVANLPVLPIGIPKIRPEQKEKFEQLSQSLSKFDLIFDCSTDMEIAYMLDNMKLTSMVINLSITNGANELVVVTGNDIAEDKTRIFNDLNTDEKLIFEGEGCAFPTFRASYVDINLLLNFALKNLDYRLNQEIFNPFVVKTKETLNSFQLEIDEY